MTVTVCELPNETPALERAWMRLVLHVHKHNSEFVLLPEMPFYRWLAHTRDVDASQWEQAVRVHEAWVTRLADLSPDTVISTYPITLNGKRQNTGYVWVLGRGVRNVHTKYTCPMSRVSGKQAGTSAAMEISR